VKCEVLLKESGFTNSGKGDRNEPKSEEPITSKILCFPSRCVVKHTVINIAAEHNLSFLPQLQGIAIALLFTTCFDRHKELNSKLR
jgi:hypothetical protein